MKEEALLLLLKVSAKRKGIGGQIHLTKVTPTPTGAVLTIEVDSTASEGLAENNNVLNVGSSGDVKFQATARRAGSLRLEAEKEDLEKTTGPGHQGPGGREGRGVCDRDGGPDRGGREREGAEQGRE